MYCSNCGKQIPNGSKFCRECGVSTAQTTEQISVHPPSPKTEIMSSQNKCKKCGRIIDSKVKKCPHCGAKQKGCFSVLLTIVLSVLLFLYVLGTVSDALQSASTRKAIASPPPSAKPVATIPSSIATSPTPTHVRNTSKNPTISPGIIYSANDITILVREFEYNKTWGGYYAVKLTIENNRLSEIDYDFEGITVNGYQIPSFYFGTVYPKMETDIEISLNADDLKLAGIEHITDINLIISFCEVNNEIDYAKISIRTSDFGLYEQKDNFNGLEVYNDENVRIFARLGNKNEDFPAIFFIENKSERIISIGFSDIAINRKMAAQYVSGTNILPMVKCVTGIPRYMFTTVGDIDIPTNDNIDSINLKLRIIPVQLDGSFTTANAYETNTITIAR